MNGLSIPHGVGSVWRRCSGRSTGPWSTSKASIPTSTTPSRCREPAGHALRQRGLQEHRLLADLRRDPRRRHQAANSFFGGEDVCLLWETFAAFGLGTDAISGGSNSTRPTNGFALPAACDAPPPPPPGCASILHQADFESGAAGWIHSASASSCTTGSWVVGDPNQVTNGGVVTQLGDDNTSGGVNAFFTQPNSSAGNADVDGGVCTALSPVINASGSASVEVEIFYYTGQRDAGDDPTGDFFRIELSNDGGATFPTNLASVGDVTSNAVWTRVRTTVTNPDQIRLRVQASDGPSAGDLVEAGIDDVLVCVPN